VFSPGHYGAALRRFLGARILFDLSSATDRKAWVNNATLLALTVDGRFLDARPEAVTKVLTALLEAAEWARTHRMDTGRIVASETGNAEELVGEIFGENFNKDIFPTLSTDAIELLDFQNHFLFEHGFIPRIVPPEEWIERGPLEQALAGFRASAQGVV
jgi:ABC-type nitrate/sulfonate/bicarbonate transport system substrate-binding protein